MIHLVIVIGLIIASLPAFGELEVKCGESEKSASRALAPGEIWFGASDGEYIQPLVVWDGQSLKDIPNQTASASAPIFSISSGQKFETELCSETNEYTTEGPIRYLKVKKGRIQKYQLFSTSLSKSKAAVNLKPTQKELALFSSIKNECVEQIEDIEDRPLPCAKPILIATSDLDQDGFPEFWFVEPYAYGNQFVVGELEGKKIREIKSECMPCIPA